MASHVKRKRSFGSVTVDHLSPAKQSEWPKAINIKLSFKEALKLHLGLGRLLGHLTSHDHAALQGRRAAVSLCLRPGPSRITITEGRLRQ